MDTTRPVSGFIHYFHVRRSAFFTPANDNHSLVMTEVAQRQWPIERGLLELAAAAARSQEEEEISANSDRWREILLSLLSISQGFGVSGCSRGGATPQITLCFSLNNITPPLFPSWSPGLISSGQGPGRYCGTAVLLLLGGQIYRCSQRFPQ